MLLFLFFFFSLLLSPCSTLFPYTTLFRSKLYIDLFRGLPIIVTLFMTFFLLPELNIMLNSYFSAVAGLSVWCSANIAEVVRGAIQSIPLTQTEAGLSLGLSPFQSMRYVVFPQAIRRMLPSLISL